MKKNSKQIIEYRDYDLDPDYPVLILTGEEWHISEIRSNVLHFHNCLEIGICHSDSGKMEFNKSPYSFEAGDVTFVSKNIPHTTYSDKGKSSLWSYIFLDPMQLFSNYISIPFHHNSDFLQMLDEICVILSPAKHPEFAPIVQMIIDESVSHESNYKHSVIGLIMTLMMKLLRLYRHDKNELISHDPVYDARNNATKNALAISPALAYIHDNFMNDINIEYLAELCELSQTHFRRLFNDTMQCSPLYYLNSYRIKQACAMLRLTNYSILEISEKVGFHSISSFNRLFLSIISINPREYRKTLIPEKKGIKRYSGWTKAETPADPNIN